MSARTSDLIGERRVVEVAQAAGLIARFTTGKTLADYLEDQMLRAAVERKFEIVGEALAQLAMREASVSH